MEHGTAPPQFETITHRAERGRLEVKPASGGLEVANGFEQEIGTLVVRDETGELYFGRNVPAGASTVSPSTVNVARPRTTR